MVGYVLLLCTLTGTLTACAAAPPTASYGFVARLGRDTIAVERISRHDNVVISDAVDRFPRVRQRHTEIFLAPDGTIRRLDMHIETPSEPVLERDRHVVANVTHDSVLILKEDGSGTVRRAFATNGGMAMAHVPQMYSLYELYFQAALRHAAVTRLAAGDSVHMRQFYIDREFDRFPLHSGFVRPLPGHRAEIWHDWLAGIGEATFDSAGEMLSYSGTRTTYKVEVQRVSGSPDVAGVGQRFVASEAANGGVRQLSVRDTARGQIGAVVIAVDYGRPLARGRTLLGGVIPYDLVWRTGANAATQLTTSAPITLAGLRLGAGTYTLWTLPRRTGMDLIVNRQTGQWGTMYDSSHDLGRAPLQSDTAAAPTEQFTIAVTPVGTGRGTLDMRWGSFKWSAPILQR